MMYSLIGISKNTFKCKHNVHYHNKNTSGMKTSNKTYTSAYTSIHKDNLYKCTKKYISDTNT